MKYRIEINDGGIQGDIRRASIEEFETVRIFYHRVTDALEFSEYGPGWKKDIYPDPQMLKDALVKDQLYLLTAEGNKRAEGKESGEYKEPGKNIAGAMIVNSDANEAYDSFPWEHTFSQEEIMVIHALGVHPVYGRRGLAKQMVRFVLSMARENGKKAVRLDVLKGNLPAENLYPSLGFVCQGELPMYYEDTGETTYILYEYVL